MKFGLPDAAIAAIRAIFRTYPDIEKAVLYGSRAKGTYKTGSDIDLTLFGDALTADHLMRIAQALDDSTLPYMVDVSIFNHIDNHHLKEHISRVGQVFYTRENEEKR